MSTNPTQYEDIRQLNTASNGRGEQPTEPLSVYYCVFAKDEPMESRRAIYENDRSIGRVLVKALPPPHTARSITRVLRNIEGFKVSDPSQLFVPLCSQSPEMDTSFITLSSHSRPGLSVHEPMALVVESEGSLRSREAVERLSNILDTREISYVYYRLYSEKGPVASETSFKEDDPSLGRINILSIKPPQTASSLKARIAKMEALRSADVQLLENIFSQKDMSDGPLSFFGASYPGHEEGQPMAFICNPLDQDTTSGRELTTREDANNSTSNPTFVYYRIFSEDGEVDSKESFDENDLPLGRISIITIKPPHTVKSLKACIASAESLSIITDAFPGVQLFTNLFCENPMSDGPISLHGESYPGCEEGEPMVLVYKQDEQLMASRRVVSNRAYSHDRDPLWFPSYAANETFYTDGITKYVSYRGWGSIEVYFLCSLTGQKGYAHSEHMDFAQD